MKKTPRGRMVSRRGFLEGAGAVLVAAPAARAQNAAPTDPSEEQQAGHRTAIRLTVNGAARSIEVRDHWTLAEVLRDHLRLTGTKIGCDRGECGACTALADGKPVYSCSQLAVWMDGHTIETVESLERAGHLDPLQAAFIGHDAPQCGFCTSGQLMSAKALLRKNTRPDAAAVSAALAGNLCRCAAYNRYVDATLAATAAGMPAIEVNRGAAPGDPIQTLNSVGKPTPRIDARERVTGKATYTGDVFLPGMLYAKVLRSPHPHARIRSIDLSKALAMPGVKAVATHENCKVVWGAGSVAGGVQYNDSIKKTTRQRRYAFNNPVRFAGEPIAAVAAVDRHTAEEALRKITVEFELLPFVLDPEEALKPDAPKIWPEGNLALNAENEARPAGQRRGSPEEAFRTAEHVFEERFTTAFVHNAQMEPRASVALWQGDKLTVYTPTGGISNCRNDMARDLGIPMENVRVICEYMGGNFGNKNQNQDADLIAATLAKMANAPVKLELSRKEDFIGMHGRWPTVQNYKVGVDREGVLLAIQLRGYSGMGPYRKNSGNIGGTEIYQCANVETVIHPVYTNRTVSGNFRGPEYPQGHFGVQSMMDEVAYRIDMDPTDFIRKNMVRRPGGQGEYTNYTLDACLTRGMEAFDWKKRWRPKPGSDPGPVKRGAGVAFMSFRSGLGRSNAVLSVDAGGRYSLHVGVTDVGGGAKTTMALIAAEALGVPLAKIDVVWGDTSVCPYSVGESGSRTTTMTGYAVIEAARDLKRQIAEKGFPSGSAILTASAAPSPTLPAGKVRESFAAHFVEVEVDVAVGRLRVLKYVAVHDCGRLINPLTAEGQIKGAITMGIGMALHENLLYDKASGQPLTTGYYYDRVPTHMDAPRIEVIFLETDDGYGPYGAKAIGEAGKVPSVAAVANAVFNATGIRFRDLPITRDRIPGALV
jgi:CO/xanthine dehydrogenase Mo-binding subunit/aerobic-type carbon monoxide dehydrogenase small subunit (CoxS/CutS family)